MKRIVAAALALSLMTGSLAAQARDHDRHDGDDRRDRHSRHDDRRAHREPVRHEARHYDRHEHRWDDRRAANRAYERGYREGRFEAGRYYRPANYRYYSWRRGARLPSAYYAPRYVVHDYGRYHLHRPPHGHHWVRVDHDVVLAAVATGAVVAVVNNLFY